MDRKQVLLLFGGESSEHDVSVSSARNVYAAIDDDQFDTLLCYIDRTGKWWLIDEFTQEVSTSNATQIVPLLGGGGFMVVSTNKTIKPDALFPVLHGSNGEDGTVQGLAQLLHIPVVGCDMAASSLAMNKLATKEVLSANGITVIPYVSHRRYEEVPDFGKVTMQLGNPLFVKPARAGSSVGVSKVHTASEFKEAIEAAHVHDSIVLIEKAIHGRELELGILGTPPHHKASGVGEIIPGEEFYTYEDKYSAGSTAQVITNPVVDDTIVASMQGIAKRVYEVLGCSGLARIDFLLADDGTPYVLEVNTLPGFTNISMYPKLWRAQGVGYGSLIAALITDALDNATIKAENLAKE